MAKNKGQYLLDGTFQQWWDIEAYHKGNDTFDLAIDETDGLLYLQINGQNVGDGVDVGSGGSATRYAITKNLTKASLSNSANQVVSGATYVSSVTPSNGYEVNSVFVTMGGEEVQNAYDSNTNKITVRNVIGDLSISVAASKIIVDLLNVTWANHAITCGQNTNNYNAWSPHNFQYDDVHDCFVFLQCHCTKHINGVFSKWTLSIIDPYDPTYCEDIPLPAESTLGMLFIENGVWTVTKTNGSYRYRSTDMGQTWVKEVGSAASGSHIFGIYKAGNKYFAGNDSNSEHTYYVSNDLLNWETKSFGDLGYSILCETTFCEFQGKIWAFNRTNDSELGHPVILNSSDGGETWTVFSDQLLHGYRSTVSCLPFATYIAIADIDRDGGIAYYSIFDGEAVTEIKSWAVAKGGDDFHNINLVTNYQDAVIVEFMHGSPGTQYQKWRDQLNCENVMIVGGTQQLPSVQFYGDEVYNYTDLATYANEHFAQGTNGVALTNWKQSTAGTFICDQTTDKTFFTEIELPIDLVVWYTGGTNVFTSGIFYDGGKQQRTWNNDPDNGFVWTANIQYGYAADPIVSIGEKRYFVSNIPKDASSNKLIIMNSADFFVENYAVYTGSNNTITDQSWQEDLGFRRVIPVNRSSAYNWSLGTNLLSNKPAETPMFKKVRYIPAPAADDD